MNNEILVAVSGGFDPIHVGHIRMFKEARKLGDKLVVIINNDNWLLKKKGYKFMDEKERLEILQALKYVDDAILTSHEKDAEDTSVCEELRWINPDVFANGGDRKQGNIPEYELCRELGIEMRFNVGGEKEQSSSELVKRAVSRKLTVEN